MWFKSAGKTVGNNGKVQVEQQGERVMGARRVMTVEMTLHTAVVVMLEEAIMEVEARGQVCLRE